MRDGLRVTKTPPLGGDTAFATMYLAYEFLSDPLKHLLDGLTAIHDGSPAWTAGYGAKPDRGKAYLSLSIPSRPPIRERAGSVSM